MRHCARVIATANSVRAERFGATLTDARSMSANGAFSDDALNISRVAACGATSRSASPWPMYCSKWHLTYDHFSARTNSSFLDVSFMIYANHAVNVQRSARLMFDDKQTADNFNPDAENLGSELGEGGVKVYWWLP
eukprot:6180915-Pleurochrysis_carterae.AAC.1